MRHIKNPPNPYFKYTAEFLGEPPPTKLEVFEETATRTIISKNDSPDVGFTYSVNCYRGCIHGCTYCFARPYHEYLGYGAGTDFETKIVAKINAPKLLRKELRKKSLAGQTIGFSFATDPYIPIETNYELTRKCLEACRDFRNPVVLVTKSALVTRDIDLLVELNAVAGAVVFFSIPFLTLDSSKIFEPYAPRPEVRFEAMKKLSEAGIPVGLALAPIIPTYNDSEIPALLERAYQCGARHAFMTILRLATESLREYFIARLNEKAPTKADKILNQIRRERGGKPNNSNFGERMRGTTEQWKIAEKLFDFHFRRLGFEKRDSAKAAPRSLQIGLFE